MRELGENYRRIALGRRPSQWRVGGGGSVVVGGGEAAG